MKRIYRTKYAPSVIERALRDYQSGDMTTERIAKKYHVCSASLTVWARRAGLLLRARGRRRMTEPTKRQQAIIALARIANYSAVGSAFGMTKQGVSRIVRRWKLPVEARPANQSAPRLSPGWTVPWGQLTEQDITGDVERVIIRAVRPYVDESNPMLHFDELRAECRAKLAKILDHGCLAKCPTRAKLFGFLRTSFRNHVRSLVQKYVFTAKRTGRKPAQATSGTGEDDVAQRKPCHVSLDDPENPVQIGREDDSFRRQAFLEELRSTLTPGEEKVLDYLLNEPFCVAGNIADAGVVSQHPKKRLPELFLKARESIRRKCRAILADCSTALPAGGQTEESPTATVLCTVADANYGDSQRHAGTEVPPEIAGRAARLQQHPDDNTPGSAGGSDRSGCGGHVIQSIGSPDPNGRIGGGGGASDGGGDVAKGQSLATASDKTVRPKVKPSQDQPSPPWKRRARIVCFRICDDDAEALEKLVWEGSVAGVNSLNKFARKVVLDFLEGRLQ